MNGGMDYPPHYDLAGRFERATISMLRWMSTFWNAIIPGKKLAALILVANKRTYDALPSNIKNKRVIELVENGVDLGRFGCDSRATRRESSDIIRITYLGRLVDWKCVDLLLDACKKLIGRVTFRVRIVGDGPERGALQKKAQELSLNNQVRFHGWLPQTAAAALLQDSDVMVLPSMRECGGAAVLEAMASGIPVIATDWGGPADYITADTGILIPPSTPERFAEELADAIKWLAENPKARVEMGQAGRRRAQSFYDWHVKAKALLNIYNDVVKHKVA